MPPAERLARQIAFLIECDRLKDIVRQTLNAHSGRPENDAEHSWALCLFVMTLAEHSNTPIDVLRVMKMLLIHDIVEIDAGDTFAYDTARLVDQHEREAAAANPPLWTYCPTTRPPNSARSGTSSKTGRQQTRGSHTPIDRCQAMLAQLPEQRRHVEPSQCAARSDSGP
jgi:hypothetical protein